MELTLNAGKVTKKRLDDCWSIVEELGAELYGIGFAQEDVAAAPKATKEKPKVGIDPFTGQRIALPAKKPAAEKAVAKKAAAKKKVPTRK